MRVAIALTALCTLAACVGTRQEPNETEGRDIALEEGSPPSASDEAVPGNATTEATAADAPKPEPGNATAGAKPARPCPRDDKWCTDPAAPLAAPDVTCCWNTAKQCYDFARDPSLCDALIEHCQNLPVPPPPSPSEPSPYEQCVIKAKDCYASGADPRDCDAHLLACEKLREPPPPDAYELCVQKANECYAWSKDAPSCDAIRASCEVLIEPKRSSGPE